MLTPEDIHDAQFRVKLKGYDIKQVNHFLDKVLKDYQSVIVKNNALSRKNKKLLAFKNTNQAHVSDISGAIMTAQTAAQHIKAQAQKRANDLFDSAKVYCNQQRLSAEQNHEAIIKNAKQQASDILLRGQYQLARLQLHIARLDKKANMYQQTLLGNARAQLQYLKTHTIKATEPYSRKHSHKGTAHYHNPNGKALVYFPNGSTKTLDIYHH